MGPRRYLSALLVLLGAQCPIFSTVNRSSAGSTVHSTARHPDEIALTKRLLAECSSDLSYPDGRQRKKEVRSFGPERQFPPSELRSAGDRDVGEVPNVLRRFGRFTVQPDIRDVLRWFTHQVGDLN